jgi:hypothetical protein
MNIYIVDLESVPTRYTCEWKTHLPVLFKNEADRLGRSDVKVINISGGDEQLKATPGAFLNFAQTNIYKNTQLSKIARLFSDGVISEGDHFIFTDAWNPAIIQLKYMSELLGIPVITHGLWHAGSYDPQDFLGRLIGNKPWVRYAERSFFECFDHNHFATKFHIDLFIRELLGGVSADAHHYLADGKMVLTGWPMEYMTETLQPYVGFKKRDLILFPHRIAPEKQPERFRELAAMLPQYEWAICQEQELTKAEYHTLLGESKMVLSLNLQETLGISCFEGAVVDSLPLVPDRLSYSEMYDDTWKYPSEWSDNEWDNGGKEKLAALIQNYMDNYANYVEEVIAQTHSLQRDFFSAGGLLDTVFSYRGKQ